MKKLDQYTAAATAYKAQTPALQATVEQVVIALVLRDIAAAQGSLYVRDPRVETAMPAQEIPAAGTLPGVV